jgi:hypothetical protein
MNQEIKELQRLKGVGKVLSQRFAEAGLDSISKVARASEEKLKKINGLNPGLIPSIIAQAGELILEAKKSRLEQVEALKKHALSIKAQMQEIARAVRDRFPEDIGGKAAKKAEKEFLRVLDSLEKVEGGLEKRLKRAEKALSKTEKRIEGMADAGVEAFGRGLKKTRKSLKKVIATK